MHRNKMDAEVFNGAVRRYLVDWERNESCLGKYAADTYYRTGIFTDIAAFSRLPSL